MVNYADWFVRQSMFLPTEHTDISKHIIVVFVRVNAVGIFDLHVWFCIWTRSWNHQCSLNKNNNPVSAFLLCVLE